MSKSIKEEIQSYFHQDDQNHWNGYEVNNVAEIIKLLKENKFFIINNHNDKEEKIDGYIIVERPQFGFEYIAPVFNGAYFSINPLYIGNDGKVHVSTRSIGGAVAPFQHDGSIEKAIECYNKEHKAGSMIIRDLEETITSYVSIA